MAGVELAGDTPVRPLDVDAGRPVVIDDDIDGRRDEGVPGEIGGRDAELVGAVRHGGGTSPPWGMTFAYLASPRSPFRVTATPPEGETRRVAIPLYQPH